MVCAFPAVSAAQEAAGAEEAAAEEKVSFQQLAITIKLGLGSVDLNNDSAKHGEYDGLTEDGVFLLGDALIDWDREGRYLSFRAKDLGLDSRQADIEGGVYGGYRYFLDYSEIPHFLSKNSKVVHDGDGTERLTLPGGFTPGVNPAAMSASLATYKRVVELDLDRTRIGGGFSIPFGKWSFEANAKREMKEGTKSIGSVVGAFGGDRRSIVLPEPVDYTTDEFTTTLGYRNRGGRLQVKYHVSNFTNKKDHLTWDVPYTGTGLPTTARTLLPPNSQSQRYNISGNMGLGATTRISGVAEYGQMKQNDSFLPYSLNSSAPLPRSSANAQVDTTHFMVNVSSRPITRLSVSARYKHYKTDNKTPQDTFLYIKNDGTTQASASDSFALINLPFGYTQDRITLNTTYNILRGTNVKLAYVAETMDRKYREVEKTKEDTIKLGLNSRFSPLMTARLNYSVASKKAEDDYDHKKLYEEYHTSQYLGSASDPGFINHPEIRKFDIANRDRTKYGAKFSFFPSPIATVGLYYNFLKDDYKDTVLGLEKVENQNYTLDAVVIPNESVSIYAFYTLEIMQTRQTSRYYANPATQSQDTTRDWSMNQYDKVPTYGLGLNLLLVNKTLEIDANYTFSESATSIKFNAGSALAPPENMPDLKTKLSNFKLDCKYRFTNGWRLGLGYEYETYESDDWATDNLVPMSGQLPQAIAMTGSTPDYTAHIGMLYVIYDFVRGGDDE